MDLPFTRIEKGPLPFAADAFDSVVLVFVLHHARGPEALIGEAVRVARRVIVWETVPRTWAPKPLLQWIDQLINTLRPAGPLVLSRAPAPPEAVGGCLWSGRPPDRVARELGRVAPSGSLGAGTRGSYASGSAHGGIHLIAPREDASRHVRGLEASGSEHVDGHLRPAAAPTVHHDLPVAMGL